MRPTLPALALALGGCAGPSGDPVVPSVADAAGQPDAVAEAPPPEREGWTLVWSDEFDGPAGSPPDPTKWVHDVGGHGWGNAQLEFDTDRVSNAAHDGEGHLVLTAREEAFGGRAYTSARLKTDGTFARAYGRFEARLRQPEGAGLWPAFWLLGADFGTVGWPDCGEIDIMEFRGQQTRQSTGAVHGPGYAAGASIHGAYASATPLSAGFHVYAVEWGPDRIDWYVDEARFHSVTPADLPTGARWVYDHPFFVVLNLAVGGTFVGPPDASTVFPQDMHVDHVRVYAAEE